MNKQSLKDAFGWGFLLWLIGYVLGIVLFMIVPSSMVGWVIMPFGIAITLWVLLKKVKGKSFQYYLSLAIAWTLIAIFFGFPAAMAGYPRHENDKRERYHKSIEACISDPECEELSIWIKGYIENRILEFA